MRALIPVSMVVTVGLGSFVACGEARPLPVTPDVPAAAAAPSGQVAAVVDAGPTTTTTATLGAAGAGTKLTPAASPDAGRPSHQSELGRSIEDIKAIVASHRDEARACYDAALPAHPGIEGNLDVRWTIDPSGSVSEAEVDSSRSDILEPAVGDCVVAVIRKIHFNASIKRFETKAHYPFNFHPHGRKPGGIDAGH